MYGYGLGGHPSTINYDKSRLVHCVHAHVGAKNAHFFYFVRRPCCGRTNSVSTGAIASVLRRPYVLSARRSHHAARESFSRRRRSASPLEGRAFAPGTFSLPAIAARTRALSSQGLLLASLALTPSGSQELNFHQKREQLPISSFIRRKLPLWERDENASVV